MSDRRVAICTPWWQLSENVQHQSGREDLDAGVVDDVKQRMAKHVDCAALLVVVARVGNHHRSHDETSRADGGNAPHLHELATSAATLYREAVEHHEHAAAVHDETQSCNYAHGSHENARDDSASAQRLRL